MEKAHPLILINLASAKDGMHRRLLQLMLMVVQTLAEKGGPLAVLFLGCIGLYRE